MTLGEWLKQAKTQIDALDAELIALEFFAPLVPEVDRSWLITRQEMDLAKLVTPEALRRETVMRVLPAAEGYLSHEVYRTSVIQDFAIFSEYNAWFQREKGEFWRERLRMADFAVKTRATGVPLAYILGHKEFYGREFLVSPDVLIPRPETESLIDLVKSLALPEQPRMIEIGTGSGCIAVTLGLEYPKSQVLAFDISEAALDVACENGNFYQTERVEFYYSNLCRDLNLDNGYHNDEYNKVQDETEFDVLVANLPYVSKDWEWVDQAQLNFEPKRALYAAANNGLSMYKRLLKEISQTLYTNFLILEADPCQQEQLIKLARWREWIFLRSEGYGLLFENRYNYWWDYRKMKLIHKTAAEMQDTASRYGKCCGYEGFTDSELKARREPHPEYEDWFK